MELPFLMTHFTLDIMAGAQSHIAFWMKELGLGGESAQAVSCILLLYQQTFAFYSFNFFHPG